VELQSVAIGIMNYLRMMSLKDFTTQGMTSGGKKVPETEAGKKSIAHFFLLHYGFFHFGYFMFLSEQMPLSRIPPNDMMLLLICAASFITSHILALTQNLSDDFKDERPNLGTLMFYPYMRIIPMHLAIIIGSAFSSVIATVFFMVLKTFADIGMHLVEQHLFKPKNSSNSFVLKD
jgi:hypothetical protein